MSNNQYSIQNKKGGLRASPLLWRGVGGEVKNQQATILFPPFGGWVGFYFDNLKNI
jgi:hypothetical protein